LTRIIAKLTDGVEDELQKRMDDLDRRAHQSLEKMEQLAPHIGRLNEGLASIERFLSQDMDAALQRTSKTYQDSLQHAENLQQLLRILVGNVVESNSQLAFAHEQSLQQATKRVNDDMDALMAVVSTAIASSSSLQQQIVSLSPTKTPIPLNMLTACSNSPTSKPPNLPNVKITWSKAWTDSLVPQRR
jgi:predicted  nucleic acid-binding Zn-ribbon protein